MKRISKYICLLSLPLLMASCNAFDSINTNPDATNKVPASLLATGLLLNITSSSASKAFIYDEELVKQMAWGEDMESYQYNEFDRSGFDGYTTIINAMKMVESAKRNNDNVNAYDGLEHFIKAYKIYYMSMEMGDVPYEEACKGESGLIRPKYNTQKEVMLFLLADLDKAYELFSNAKNFTGDPILGGDIQKWEKATTAFELKILINLSKKEADTDLDLKARFTKVLSRGSLMESNDDNLQMRYFDKANSMYPFNTNNIKHAGYAMLSTMLIDKFKQTNDIRMFYYANPAKTKIDAGLTADNWDAYIGTDPSKPFDVINKAYANGDFSGLNTRYTNYSPGEQVVRLGYAEQNFILAEAAVRGWIQADPSLYYKQAIRAHMEFLASNTPDDPIYHHGHPITEQAIADFLQTPAIQLTGNKESDIEKILTQKYLSSFMQYTYDVYYDYRRTGYPVLPINPATNLNPVKDKIPVRWMYPDSEASYNLEHLKEALQRQFGGVDDLNKPMWIIK